MSQFDRHTDSETVEAIRSFLGLDKRTYLREHGFDKTSEAPRKGRLPRYEPGVLDAFKEFADERSRLAESSDTSFPQRYAIARDYKGLTDAAVSRAVGVSRELLRRWIQGIHACTKLARLAEVLDVPLEWLQAGGESSLPANSHIGVRIGKESKENREALFSETQELLGKIPEEADEDYARSFIEWNIFNDPHLSRLARRGGGRYQLLSGALLFSPWVTVAPKASTRRNWSDEMEAMIREELMKSPTVYGAHASLVKRCTALGLKPEEYPTKIALHKRVQKEKEKYQAFGLDFNDVIAESVAKYVQ